MWRKVKTFFHVFQGSIFPQPAYYHKITKARVSFSLKYFASLIFILNIIFAIFFIIRYNPAKIHKYLTSITQEINSIPKELVVNVNDGSLFTNYDRPYLFWISQDGHKKLLLVVDETANPSKIDIYNTYILVTSKEIVIRDESRFPNKYKVLSLRNLGRLTFEKKDFQKINGSLITLNNFLFIFYTLAIPGLLVVLPFFSFIITSLYLAIISLIVFLFFKTYYHKRIHFRKILQLSFHAVTLPLILDYFLNVFKPTIPANIYIGIFIPTPLAFLIILSIFVFVAVYEAYMAKHHPSHK